VTNILIAKFLKLININLETVLITNNF